MVEHECTEPAVGSMETRDKPRYYCCLTFVFVRRTYNIERKDRLSGERRRIAIDDGREYT